jgi:hypothetical protein
MDMSLEQAANYGLMLGSCSTAFAVSLMQVAPAHKVDKIHFSAIFRPLQFVTLPSIS